MKNPMTKRKYARLFRESAKLIDLGLYQEGFVGVMDGTICYCTTGAINQSTSLEPFITSAVSSYMFRMLEEILGFAQTGCWNLIARWNDAPHRTTEVVARTLRLAASKLDHGWTPECWLAARGARPACVSQYGKELLPLAVPNCVQR